MPGSTTKFLDVLVTERMSRAANGAVTAYRLGKIDAADHTKVAQVSGANAKCDGVFEDSAADGKEVSLACGGRVAVVCGGAVVPGDELVSDANGKAVPRGATATVQYHVIGRALTAAAADELATVKWGPYAVWGANAS